MSVATKFAAFFSIRTAATTWPLTMGGQIWFVNGNDIIDLLIDGDDDHTHAGDSLPLASPGKKISEPTAVSLAPYGDRLITESDLGYVRIARRKESMIQIMAGGADQDLDFDQFDLVQVQIAAKYLTIESATQAAYRGEAPRGTRDDVIHPQGGVSTEEGLAQMEHWIRSLAENDGNYIRVWLSAPFWDLEHREAGEYDEERAGRVDALLALARRYGIRVKMTIEHFREIDPENVRQTWASKPIHHISRGGTARNMADWLANERSREQFQKKLSWLKDRFGDEPAIFAWELWNEVNAVRGGDYLGWSEAMLPGLKRRFPRNMTLQSLGSFDSDSAFGPYRRLCHLPNNDVAQVHRYLDLGARLDVCHGPVDVLAADAVRELLAMQPDRPVILAESGAVEPRHTGPFKLYARDKAGIILHDVIFAPFFAGAAGTGQCWHWGEYVDKNNLWHQFRAFSDAVRGIDPPAEGFEPQMISHPRLRVYVLRGKQTSLLWCRDKENTWQAELADGREPEDLRDISVSLKDATTQARSRVQVYDPWKKAWSDAAIEDGEVHLPVFSRSIVVRVSST